MRRAGLALPILFFATMFLGACVTEPDQKRGIDSLLEISRHASEGMKDYYKSSDRDSDGDRVPDEVDRYPLDPHSVFFPQDRLAEDAQNEQTESPEAF